MEISDIKKLAELARINISEEEQKKLLGELDTILKYIGQIKEVAADADTNPTTEVLRNVMREDAEPHETGLYSDELLAEAPDAEKGYVKVKNIL